MLPGRRYTPGDIWQLALRHKWLILIPWVVVASGVAVFTRTLEDRYVSESLLQIISARVPQNLVRTTITSSIEERLPIITQQIMTRTRLERIVQDLGLYAQQRAEGRLMEDIIRDMREQHIRVAAIKGDAFRISYESSDPRLAMRVTERLASFFVDENARDREMQAANTNQFLDSQLDEARRRLLDSEKKVAEFNREHRGELPSQLNTNLTKQQNLESRLAQNQENLFRDRDRRKELERQIVDIESELQTAQQMVGLGDETASPAALPAAQQLEKLRGQYAQLSLKYTADYPDMRTLAQVIKEMEAKAEQEALATPLSGAPRARNPQEAARLQRLQLAKAEMARIDTQIAQREAERRTIQSQIADVGRRIEATPVRESEMIEITRDYQTLQEIYTSLFQKSEDAKVAANLERRQIGEQFKVIDPARLPERPASPDRVRFYLGGIFGGLLVGVGLVGLLEYRDSSFRTDTDIVSVLALPVLATIPAIITREDHAYARRKRKFQFIAAGLAGVALAGAAAAWRQGVFQRLF